MRRRALFAAVDDTLREITEGGGNFVGKVLAFEIAFLRNIGPGRERVFRFGKFFIGNLPMRDDDGAILHRDGFRRHWFQRIKGFQHDGGIAAANADRFVIACLIDFLAEIEMVDISGGIIDDEYGNAHLEGMLDFLRETAGKL